jgi:hypothetical protein
MFSISNAIFANECKICISEENLCYIIELSSYTSYISMLKALNLQIENVTFQNFTYSDDFKKGTYLIRFDELGLRSGYTTTSFLRNISFL